MRVGIFINKINQDIGGGYTYQDTVLNSIGTCQSSHEFYIFYYGHLEKNNNPLTKYISLDKYSTKKNSYINKIFQFRKLRGISTPLNDAIKDNNIELTWFIAPNYEKINSPYVITVWDLQHRLQPFFPEVSTENYNQEWDRREKFYSAVLPRAAYIITGTETGKNEIMQFYGISQERIKLIPHPAPFEISTNNNINNVSNSFKDKLPKHFLFYPAQFWPHKNHITALLTLKKLITKYGIDISLVFTGSDKGNLTFIKQITKEMGLINKVYFLGFVSKNELIYLYRKAFCLLYLTLFGPENLPPLEAFALGCPVIASQVSGAKEQLGDASILVDSFNESGIAEIINKLWNDSNLKHQMISKGYKRAELFLPKKYFEGMCKILDEFELYRRCWGKTYISS